MNTEQTPELKLYKGRRLGKNYRIEAFLGEGGFGVVAKCRNINNNRRVAIKVNKNDPDICLQARQEIKILKKLLCLNSEISNIVHWHGFFFDEQNICLIFELLDQSLFEYMEDRPEGTLPITEVKDVLHQLSVALCYLNDIGVVHADVKPDNIMVVGRHKKPIRVKLIDFGLAFHVSDFPPEMSVQTTWYRAPEVCLNSLFNEAIDMWSLGLTAAEIAVGFPLYPGDTDYDVLSFIIATQGQIPDHVLDEGLTAQHFFNHHHDDPQHWSLKTWDQYQDESGVIPLDIRHLLLSSLDDLEKLMEEDRGHSSDHGLLVDLIKRMMHLDQDQRIKPQEVLQHPFLSGSFPQNSSADVCSDVTNTQEAAPETSSADVQINMADIKDNISEPSQRPSCPEVCFDMTDTIEATCSVQTGNTSQAAESENVGWFRGFIEWITRTVQSFLMRSRSPQRENKTLAADSEDVEIQPERNTNGDSWFGTVVKAVTDTHKYFFSWAEEIPSTSGTSV